MSRKLPIPLDWLLVALAMAIAVGWFVGAVPVARKPAALLVEPADLDRGEGSHGTRQPTVLPGETPVPAVVFSSWTTWEAALAESRDNGKPVLVEFGAEWCEPCLNLRRDVFDNPAATATISAAVIPVAIVDRVREDGENPPEVDALERRFKVDAYPTLVVYSPATGKSVRRQGYPGADETLRWITEAALRLR